MTERFIGDYIDNPYHFQEGRAIEGLISSNNFVGIEVEIENVRYHFQSDSPSKPKLQYFEWIDPGVKLNAIDKHWSIVKDNSLRYGSEFIFNGPKKGREIIEALTQLQMFFDTYKSQGEGPIASDRCSVHCHLDVRDLTGQELDNLIMVYILFERLLFAYVHPSRLKNNYCRPITDSGFKHTLINIRQNAAPEKFAGALQIIRNKCDKYSALNLLPLQSFGTVEFRHHEGTTSILKGLLEWVNIILAFKLAAKIDPYYLLSIYRIKGPKALMVEVFDGTYLASSEFLDKFEVEYLIHKGVMDFIELCNFNILSEVTNKPVTTYDEDLMKIFIKRNGLNKRPVKSPSPRTNKPQTFSEFMAINPQMASQWGIPQPVELFINESPQLLSEDFGSEELGIDDEEND